VERGDRQRAPAFLVNLRLSLDLMRYQWPVLSTESLEDDPRLLQRAHAVLAWLVQYYAHSIPTDRPGPIRIPMSLAVPLVRVSEILRMAPILTFADTVLWNAHPRDPCRPLSTDNIYFENTFSGTEDEDNFYKLSASVELRGVEAIQIVHRYLNLDNPQDRTNESGLRSDLVQLKAVLEELTDLMGSVRQAVDPKVFYWQIRPWFNGSGSSGRQRWVYEGVDESTVMDTSGPSAGQSGIIHTIDAFLGVDHRQLRCPIPSVQQHGNVAFMDRMRRYMQGSHRDFLNHIDDIPVAIKKVAMEQSGLREAYNDAVGALKRLRGIHIQVACLYVINMAGSHPPDGLRRRETQRQLDGARGTGGNHVESLLKAGQDATQRAILE